MSHKITVYEDVLMNTEKQILEKSVHHKFIFF